MADFQAILDSEIEGVVIATPPISHYDLARRALEAGKDVFVEKPLTRDPVEARELCILAASGNRVLMVGHLLIYHPGFRRLKELAREGHLGDLRYAYTQRVNLGIVRKDENALWSLAPHDVALLLDLFEEQPQSVTAQGASYLTPGIEDVSFVQLSFPSGRAAAIHVSWLDPHKERRLTVVGSRRMAVFDDMQASEKLRIYDRGVDVSDYVPFGENMTLRFGDVVLPSLPVLEPLHSEMEHFASCIRDRSRPKTSGEEGMRVVEVLAAANRSLKLGGAPTGIDPSGGGSAA